MSNGETWRDDSTVVVRADGRGKSGDNGYPISVQLDDKSLLTVYYTTDAESITYVAGTH